MSASSLSLQETGKEMNVGTEKEAIEKGTEKEKPVGVKNFLTARIDEYNPAKVEAKKQKSNSRMPRTDGQIGEVSAVQLRRPKQQI